MRRITSLDFARGLAVMGMTLFHGFFNSWDFFGTGDLGSLTWQLPFAFLFFIFGHWRGFFIMISAAVHTYVMAKRLKEGNNRLSIMLKNIFAGFVLWGIGTLYNAIFNTFGIIDTWHRTHGTWNWQIATDFVFFVEALQDIAFSIIIASIIFYFISRKDGMKKLLRNSIIFSILGLIIIFVAPFVQQGINQAIGIEYQPGVLVDFRTDAGPPYLQPNPHPFARYWLIFFGGREAPIFPMLAPGLVGIIIGMWLAQDKPSKKFLKVGYWTSLGLFLLGGLWFVLVDSKLFTVSLFSTGPNNSGVLVFQHVHPTWFMLSNTGLELAALLFLIHKVEFNPKLKVDKWLRRSRFVRRWGIVALTVYMSQVLIFIPEKVLNIIAAAGGFSWEYVTRYQMPFLNAALLSVVFFIAADIVIRIWDKLRFIGTWEWLFAYINLIVGRRKINHLDPIRTRGIVYDVEPVMFVDVMVKAKK